MSEILTREEFGIALVLYRDAKPPTSNRNSRALFAHDAALRAALDKAKEALMKIRDGIDGEYIATQRGVAIAANALAELEGKNA